MMPCKCEAYSFPHRPGGGDCSGEGDGPVCRSCGSNDIHYRRSYRGARDREFLGGRWIATTQLEPDEPAGFECGCCGSEDIAKDYDNWQEDYIGEDYE